MTAFRHGWHQLALTAFVVIFVTTPIAHAQEAPSERIDDSDTTTPAFEGVPELEADVEIEEREDLLKDNLGPEPGSELDDEGKIQKKSEEIDRPLQGKPMGRVEFDCDLDLCRDPRKVRVLTDITGLSVGKPYSTQALRRAERRLAKTGFFDALRVEKRLVDDSVFITITARGATLIRKVRFKGVDAPPFESELRKILIYRQGQPYTDDESKATAQLESMENLFEEDGYFGTEIAMVVRQVEDASHQVDIIFRIEKGEPRRICDIGIRGIRAMAYAEARGHLLSENNFFARRFGVIPLNFTTEAFKEGQQALVEAYRQRGYFETRIVEKVAKFEPNSSCVTLLVDVSEGPRWKVGFDGNERFTDIELREELPFFESGYVDVGEIDRAERAIKQLYETRGYPFTEVKGEETRHDRLDRTITFDIDEGPQLEVREIAFHGNDNGPREELLDQMQTRTFGLFETGGYLQKDQLLADFLKIEEYYRQKGFLQATVERFAVEVLEEGQGIGVHIYIRENDRTRVDRLEIDGNRKVPDGTLIEELKLVEGAPFVPLELRADRTRMLQQYSAFGYPMAKVETTCRDVAGDEVPCKAPKLPRGCVARSLEELEGMCRWEHQPRDIYICRRRSDDARCEFTGGITEDRMAARHQVAEGPLVEIGHMLLNGNFETGSSVIYREIPLERGDLLDTGKVIEAQGNLRSLNVFDAVTIESIGLDEGVEDAESAVATLLINVEESRTESVEFKFGLEFREILSEERRLLVTGEAEYVDRNLFGLAQGFNPRLISAIDTLDLFRIGRETATKLDPTKSIDALDFLVGVELIYSHPRFLKGMTGIDKLLLTLAPFYLLDLVGVFNQQVLREEWGLRTELRKEIFERFFLKLGLEFKQIASFTADNPIIDGERVFSPRRTIGKLTPEFALDRRDSPLNPREGYIVRLIPSLVSGDALGQGGEDFFDDSFLRLTISGSYYIPIWEDFVLAQSIRAGEAFPLFGRENPVPAEERFFLGGVRSVRGFPDNSLGPISERQQVATGGEFMLNYNVEVRYPLLKQYGIYGATFFDAGLLSDCRSETSLQRDCYEDAFGRGQGLDNVRTAAGLGLRLLILDQIPVVLDYGLVLNRNAGEKYGQIHANIGYTFD